MREIIFNEFNYDKNRQGGYVQQYPEGEIFIESLSSEEKSDIAITLKNTYDGASKDQILYAMAQIKMQLKNTKDRAEREQLKEKLSVLKILYSSAKSVEKKEKKLNKKIKK